MGSFSLEEETREMEKLLGLAPRNSPKKSATVTNAKPETVKPSTLTAEKSPTVTKAKPSTLTKPESPIAAKPSSPKPSTLVLPKSKPPIRLIRPHPQNQVPLRKPTQPRQVKLIPPKHVRPTKTAPANRPILPEDTSVPHAHTLHTWKPKSQAKPKKPTPVPEFERVSCLVPPLPPTPRPTYSLPRMDPPPQIIPISEPYPSSGPRSPQPFRPPPVNPVHTPTHPVFYPVFLVPVPSRHDIAQVAHPSFFPLNVGPGLFPTPNQPPIPQSRLQQHINLVERNGWSRRTLQGPPSNRQKKKMHRGQRLNDPSFR